jgi:hypothetical protein
VLTPGAVDELEASVDPAGSAIGTPEIAFVLVYSLNHDNDGQPVTVQGQSGSTGAVICRNTEVVAAPAATSQTTDIGSNNVTILDAEEAFIVRYQIGSTIEKRVCHTVNQNTDCYRISP